MLVVWCVSPVALSNGRIYRIPLTLDMHRIKYWLSSSMLSLTEQRMQKQFYKVTVNHDADVRI